MALNFCLQNVSFLFGFLDKMLNFERWLVYNGTEHGTQRTHCRLDAIQVFLCTVAMLYGHRHNPRNLYRKKEPRLRDYFKIILLLVVTSLYTAFLYKSGERMEPTSDLNACSTDCFKKTDFAIQFPFHTYLLSSLFMESLSYFE